MKGKLEFLELSYDSIRKNKKSFITGVDYRLNNLTWFSNVSDSSYISAVPHTSMMFDMNTQYLVVLTICRHAIDYRFMAVLRNTSEATRVALEMLGLFFVQPFSIKLTSDQTMAT